MTMKLRFSPTSPYVRKVLVVAHEAGLIDRVKIVPTLVANPDADFYRVNPLGRIPALELEGGETLYDSPVICEYLDSLHDGVKLFPPAGGARWTALRRQALADGVLDAAVLRRAESLRPPERRFADWDAKHQGAVIRALDALEQEADGFGSAVTIGQVTVGCALGYLDFRFAAENWRDDRPALADWYDGFSARRSMAATEPRDP